MVATASLQGVSASAVSPALLLPTFEARFFLPNGHSVDLSLPLVNSVISSLLVGGFVAGLDAFYNLNLGGRNVRFLVGPGMGLAVAIRPPLSVIDLRIPMVLGVEFLTDRQGLGFSLQARPLLDIGIGSTPYGSIVGVGGGFMAMLAIHGYATRD